MGGQGQRAVLRECTVTGTEAEDGESSGFSHPRGGEEGTGASEERSVALPTGFAEELHLGAPHFVQVANVPPAGTASLSLNTAARPGQTTPWTFREPRSARVTSDVRGSRVPTPSFLPWEDAENKEPPPVSEGNRQ